MIDDVEYLYLGALMLRLKGSSLAAKHLQHLKHCCSAYAEPVKTLATLHWSRISQLRTKEQ
jgi:hypothetical protein